MNSPMSIAQRLSLGFGLVLSLMILITLIGVQRVGFIDETLTAVRDGAALKQRYAINFRGSVHDRAIAIRDAVLDGDGAALAGHLGEIQRLDRFYQESAQAMETLLAKQAPTAAEQRLLENIKTIERSTLALTEQLISLRRDGNQAALPLLLERVSPAYSEWLKHINAFIDHQEEVISQDLGQVREVAGGFRLLILLVTGAALLLSVGISLVIINKLKSTLGAEPHRVAQVIQQLAKGELDQQIETQYPNSVMADLQNMVRHLSDTIAQVRSAATELTHSSDQLMATSDSNNQQIRLQSSEAEQMATAINQMAATVSEVANYAASAAAAPLSRSSSPHRTSTGIAKRASSSSGTPGIASSNRRNAVTSPLVVFRNASTFHSGENFAKLPRLSRMRLKCFARGAVSVRPDNPIPASTARRGRQPPAIIRAVVRAPSE
mgnify:CR=1 FL=1